MKKTLLASAILAASMFSAAAMAEAPEYYVWGDVGGSHTTSYDDYFAESDRDLDTNMYGMGFGFTFQGDKFFEAGYLSLGTSEFSGESRVSREGVTYDEAGSMENEHEAFVIRLGKLYQWNRDVAFHLHLGAAYAQSETTGSYERVEVTDITNVTSHQVHDKESNVIGMAGLGLRLNLTENLEGRVMLERMINFKSGYGSYHLDNLTAGLSYRF